MLIMQMMVMSLFAVFWLSFGLLQMPTLGLASAYSATGNAAEGAASKEYNAVVGLYLIVWGFALLTFWIFTLKTNAVFAGIFGFVTLAAWVLAGAYFKVGSGDYESAGKLQKVGCASSLRLLRAEPAAARRLRADGRPGWRSSAFHRSHTRVSVFVVPALMSKKLC